MDVKYRYALSNTKALIHISTLSPERRYEGAPYQCPSCYDGLIPVLGSKTTPHFRHQTERPCAPEGYLHHLAKHVFYATYLDCVTQQKPFMLRRQVYASCNAYEEPFEFTCSHSVEVQIDLTRYFDRAEVEAVCQEYRADVLLSSSKHADKIMVEFVVTNAPSPEKLSSGIRIIEVTVRGEAMIDALREPWLEVLPTTVKCHHFHFKDIPSPENRCEGSCKESKKVLVFTVYSNGKSRMLELSPQEAYAIKCGETQGQTLYEEIYGLKTAATDVAALFVEAVRKAHFRDVKLKNCFLCKYHGASNGDSAIYCKANRESVGSNEAVSCSKYRTLPRLSDYDAIDATNREYQSNHRGRRWFRGWWD